MSKTAYSSTPSEFSHSGWLIKEGGTFKSWRKRWCVLKDGVIHYSKHKDSAKDLGTVHLEDATGIDPVPVYKRKKFIFKIPTPDRTYYLKSQNEKERQKWIDVCRASKDEIIRRNNPVSTEGGEKSGSTKRIGIEDFELKAVIGKGSFGRVLMVIKKTGADAGKVYAMKVLNKGTVLKRHEEAHTKTEKKILQTLKHPFLVNLYYSFQTADKLYFIMDYVNGGELFYHLQKDKTFKEDRARFYCAQIVCGLAYMHSKGVLYRDLKPENLLITAEGNISMTDFGISKQGLIAANAKTATFCGTPEYLAPEVLDGEGYGLAVDWWSFGTLMYEMLTGLPPFYSQDVQTMYKKIMAAKLVLTPAISEKAADLLGGLLKRNPAERLTNPDDIKKHPWFASIDWDKLEKLEVKPPYIPPVKDAASLVMIDPAFTGEDIDESDAPDVELTEEEQSKFQGFTYAPGMDGDEESE